MFPLKFILFSYFLTRSLFCCVKIERKRILVNDHDFTLQKLQSMESKLQELTGSIAQQQTKLQEMTGTIAQQQTKLQEMTGTMAQQQTTINTLRSQQMSQVSGAIFVRWGRTTCPDNGTELVYAGYMGGTGYDRHGGVADSVCLPPDPNLGQTRLDSDTYVQRLYGGQYDFSALKNDDVPCAVCRSLKHSASLMIPAKTTCYSGWKLEYEGTLVSDRYTHDAATQFVCLDAHFEAIPGSKNFDFHSTLFVPVIGKCGSLQCPPYESNRIFPCVVCSK